MMNRKEGTGDFHQWLVRENCLNQRRISMGIQGEYVCHMPFPCRRNGERRFILNGFRISTDKRR